MMCMFCAKRSKCWEDMQDSELMEQWVKCGYDDYELAEEIDIEDLIQESQRRTEERE